MSSSNKPEDRDARFERIVADYLHAAENGAAPDQAALIAEHPDLADDLRSFFANHAAMERVAEPIRHASADEPTIGLAPGSLEQTAKSRIRYVGDYELVEEIARGGMGVVYKARQKSLNRSVAVKMILAGQLADDSAVRRFKQEAEAAASLDHPHIVPIYEVGEHDGRHYFSMGLVEGMSLAQRIAAGPMPTRDAAELVRTVAVAVQYAHERNVIHRDLKPANILLDEEGRPRITDFGLAKRTVEGQSLTETGQVLGTPGYMPPEQVQAKDIGPAADVYSLGAILYALLTGRPPFVSATAMETMLQVLAAEPVSPRQLNPSVPRDLDTIVMKCLEKHTNWRYRTAQELAEELNRFLTGEPIHARRPGIIEQGVRWLAKQKRSVALSIGVAVTTAALIIGVVSGLALYRKSLEGKVGFDTDHNRLAAEIRDPAGNPVLPSFTVPTQQPVTLPAGDYRLRASGKELLSEDFSVRVEQGQTGQFKLSLDQQKLWEETKIGGFPTIIRFGDRGPAAVLDFQPQGLRLISPALKQDLWTRSFNRPDDDPILRAIPGFWWNTKSLGQNESGFGRHDFRPLVLRPGPRLEGTSLGDIVLACRHQPVVMAFSANTGKTLWAYAPEKMKEAYESDRNRAWSGGGFRLGTINGAPLVVPDLDGDEIVDLIVSSTTIIADRQTDKPLPWRTIEAVSGKTGKSIWSYPLPDEWFTLLNVNGPPRPCTWFARIRGTGGGHHVSKPYANTFRDYYRYAVVGDPILVPYPLQHLRYQQQTAISCVAGTRVLLLDPKTGQELTPPQTPTFLPHIAPRVARFTKEGDDALLLAQSVGVSPWDRNPYEGHGLALWSPANNKAHWQQAVFFANYSKDERSYLPLPQWPLVVDLNGDGVDEVLTAGDSSLDRPLGYYQTPSSRAWGEIVLLGATQEDLPVWKRRLETVDQQVDQFVAGPDVNGDGWRDLFAANLFSRGYKADVYVDAISGKTGEILWSTGEALPLAARNSFDNVVLGELRWWDQSRLIVPVLYGDTGENVGLYVVATSDGRIVHQSTDLYPYQIADGDGDGIDDLFCFQPDKLGQNDQGGRLVSIRGGAEVDWRVLGGKWQAAADYNGDGIDDVATTHIEFVGANQHLLTTLSGRDGSLLYRATSHTPIWAGARSIPLRDDLNGDGVPDLVSLEIKRGWTSKEGTPPLHAFSGKTGRELWEPSLRAGVIHDSLFVDARDLEGDGHPELIYVAELDLDPAGNNIEPPLWLFVLEGNTGAVRWRQQLNDRDGYGSENFAVEYADLNGDNVADIITTAVESEWQAPELRAYDAKTGVQLWKPVSLPGTAGEAVVGQLPRPTAADLDRDGQSEILVQDWFRPSEYIGRDPNAPIRTESLEYPKNPPLPPSKQFTSRIMSVNGITGAVNWSQDFPTGSENPQTFDGGGFSVHYRSRPLVVRRGSEPSAVCIWLWAKDWQNPEGTILLLDHQGQELWRKSVPIQSGNRWFRVLVHDLDGDGRDELVYRELDTLRAMDAEQKVRWEFKLPHSLATIDRVESAAGDIPAQVVVMHGRQVTGVSGLTGKPLWVCTGLPHEHLPTAGEKLHLLRDHGINRLPHVLCTANSGETLSLPAIAVPGERAAKFVAMTSAPPSSAVNKTPRRDPRFERPLPWSSLGGERYYPFGRPVLMLFGLAYAFVFAGFPYYVFVRFRYTLRQFLMIPLAVGLILLALQLPLPDKRGWESQGDAKFTMVLIELPALVAIYLLATWLWRGKWRWPAVVAAVWAAWTIILAGIWMWRDLRDQHPQEYYRWDDWWTVLVMGAYSVGVATVIVTALTRAYLLLVKLGESPASGTHSTGASSTP